jgi:hypothetical protein
MLCVTTPKLQARDRCGWSAAALFSSAACCKSTHTQNLEVVSRRLCVQRMHRQPVA